MSQAYISIGSNIDRARNVCFSIEALATRYGALQLSSVYESDAIGFESAPFYNLVAGFETDDPPAVVQAALHDIEEQAGRDRDEKMQARPLDLDLLLYDDRVIEEDGLALPRDDIVRYAFVLRPLAEIAPGVAHPVTGECFADMWRAFDAASQPLSPVGWERLGQERNA